MSGFGDSSMNELMFSVLVEIKYLDFHTHKLRHFQNHEVMEIVSIHPGQWMDYQFFTVGMHPWLTDSKLTRLDKIYLREQMSNPYCLAMGEMGLDKLKDPELRVQEEILKSQLQIASDMHKPVVLHCVRAFDQLIKIKQEFPHISKWCIHGYARHVTLAKQLISQGFYLSFMPALPDEKLMDLLSGVPKERWFLETDSMAGVNIKDVYIRAANLMGWDPADLTEQITENAKQFFGQ